MKIERSWLCFGILGMVELQLKTNQQVCIPLIPLKEIPSQMNTSWVEFVSKVFLCLFFIFFWGTMLFNCHFFRLSFNISFDFHQVRNKCVSKISKKLLRSTVPDTDKILFMKLKPGKKRDVVGVASSSPHFPPLVLPKLNVTITAVNDPHICSTKRKLKQNKNKLTKPKIPWVFGIKILVNLDNKKIISSSSFWTFVLFKSFSPHLWWWNNKMRRCKHKLLA